jgi:hypothetical protein
VPEASTKKKYAGQKTPDAKKVFTADILLVEMNTKDRATKHIRNGKMAFIREKLSRNCRFSSAPLNPLLATLAFT